MCIELSFAARKFESSGGSSLHNASASSNSPDAVNCTICRAKYAKDLNLWKKGKEAKNSWNDQNG
jgi:hypothetical protein